MPVRKILIVEDSPTEREVLSELLSQKGYNVIIAVDGNEGVSKAKSDQPDLVIMDVVMPGVNGYQATRSIARDQATKHIPVILCTTKGQDTDKIWGMRQGALAYFVKPIDGKQLLERIAAIA
jgi:twitching motility two-component system response regulator PilH